jgi:hypothetical protein
MQPCGGISRCRPPEEAATTQYSQSRERWTLFPQTNLSAIDARYDKSLRAEAAGCRWRDLLEA